VSARRAGPIAGFVLAELLVALVIAAIIGAALTQLVISQSRLAALQGAIMQARGGARAALNVMTADLRGVGDSGLVAATPESVTVRVPYAYGVACGQLFGRVVVSLLPSDSATFAGATASGYAWRDTTGSFVFVQSVTVQASTPLACQIPLLTYPSVTTLSASGWQPTAVSLPNDHSRTPPGPPQGSVVYLYQQIQYAFAPSAQLPGRIALWRTQLTTGQRSELVAPFDSSSAIEFLVGSGLTVSTTPPADLTTVRGLRLVLVAASEQPPEGRTAPMTFNLTSDVLFRNHQ